MEETAFDNYKQGQLYLPILQFQGREMADMPSH